ncbi:hypothetical protein [Leifsonia shinshuensis]
MALEPAPVPQPLFFLDTPAGPDAALALRHLLGTGAQVAGIGAAAPDPDRTAAHTLTDLAGMFGAIRVGVFPAEASPVSDLDPAASTIAHVTLPRSTARVLRTPAASAVAQLARRHPGRIRVVALGSARNLLEALRLDRDLPRLLAGVTALTDEATHDGWARVAVSGVRTTLLPRRLADGVRLSDAELAALAGRGGAHYLLAAMLAGPVEADDGGSADGVSVPLAGALAAAHAAGPAPHAGGVLRTVPGDLRAQAVGALLDAGAAQEALKVVA